MNSTEGQSDNAPEELAKRDSDGEVSEELPPQLSEVLKDAPEPIRERIEAFFAASRSFGPSPNPLLQKLTPEHIHKVLDLQRKNDESEHLERTSQRRYALIYFSIIMVLIVFVLIVFGMIKNNPTLLTGVLSAILGSGGGGGIGYYIGQRTQRS